MELVKFDLVFHLIDKSGNEIDFNLSNCTDMNIFTREAQDQINEMIATQVIGGD